MRLGVDLSLQRHMCDVCDMADYDLYGQRVPAMVAQCAVEPEVAMGLFLLGLPLGWDRPR